MICNQMEPGGGGGGEEEEDLSLGLKVQEKDNWGRASKSESD